jgi:hypothetical protein
LGAPRSEHCLICGVGLEARADASATPNSNVAIQVFPVQLPDSHLATGLGPTDLICSCADG